MKSLGFGRIIIAILATGLLLLSGCATVKDPAISTKIKSIDTTNESIGFITLKISNTKNRGYQPNVGNVFICTKDPKNRVKFAFNVLDPYSSAKNQFNEYIISFQLKPGDYILVNLSAHSGLFPVMGTFIVPMDKQLTISEHKIIYFGHVDATIVDRTSDDQLRAGPVIPVLDQAVTGASTGTFVVDITDRYDDDIALLKSKYSYLTSTIIENRTLKNN